LRRVGRHTIYKEINKDFVKNLEKEKTIKPNGYNHRKYKPNLKFRQTLGMLFPNGKDIQIKMNTHEIETHNYRTTNKTTTGMNV